MDEIELWFNPRCSKCREAQAILDDEGVPYRLYAYLDDPPDRARIERVLEKLGFAEPEGMMRTREDTWRERGLESANRSERIAAMTAEPKLIERPIAVRGERAVIARPPERVREVL